MKSQARACPALFISAPGSNHGKTTVTAALARYYRNQGYRVRVFKAGPDFIDPTFLTQASGAPAYQLDLWMMGEARCRRLVYDAADDADVILIEGVMGLFDGTPSSADLAAALGTPVAFVVDASGTAQSLNAIAHGLASYRDDVVTAGVIVNNVASPRHLQMVMEDSRARVPVLAVVDRSRNGTIPARHLGLMLASELDGLDSMLDGWAQTFAASRLSELPPPISFPLPDKSDTDNERLLEGTTIAISRDAAFSFIYQDNLDWLCEMGATLKFFSPLHDHALPTADALYLPGGYPELHAAALADNHEMKEQIHQFFKRGGAIYAECGGMLYLLDELAPVDGPDRDRTMVGLITGRAAMQTRLTALGYQFVQVGEEQALGHTFHYSKLFDAEPAKTHAIRKTDGAEGESIFVKDNLFASYLHIYFRSAPKAMASIFAGKRKNLTFDIRCRYK